MKVNKSKLGKSIVALSITLALGACSKQPEQEQTSSAAQMEVTKEQPSTEPASPTDNPFLVAYDTPFQVPPFNKIKNEHFMPTFELGMQEQLTEIALNRKHTRYDRSIDVHISSIRKKISAYRENLELIKTVRGSGYIFINDKSV